MFNLCRYNAQFKAYLDAIDSVKSSGGDARSVSSEIAHASIEMSRYHTGIESILDVEIILHSPLTRKLANLAKIDPLCSDIFRTRFMQPPENLREQVAMEYAMI